LSVADAEHPLAAIAGMSAEFDAVVMAETDPSLPTSVFEMPTDQVAERFFKLVSVVQRKQADEEE
jgi:hypothetical protein